MFPKVLRQALHLRHRVVEVHGPPGLTEVVESGISGMRFSISETAEWGDYISGPRVINESSKAAMKAVLGDIQSGKFTKEWVEEYKAGYPKYNKFIEEGKKHPIEETGQRLRALMPWVKKRNLEGAQAAYN